MEAANHNRQTDVWRLAKLLRDGAYSYDQSKHLIAQACKAVGLAPPRRKCGSVERLREELEALLAAAYGASGVRQP